MRAGASDSTRTTHTASTASPSATRPICRAMILSSSALLLLLLGRRLGCLLLLVARALQDAGQRVVPFVARVLEHALVGTRHRDRGAPRPRPGVGILDGELVAQGLRALAREPLDQVQPGRRAAEAALEREVGRVDDQRVAIPAADRVAGEEADLRRHVLAPRQVDDPRAVDHLV